MYHEGWLMLFVFNVQFHHSFNNFITWSLEASMPVLSAIARPIVGPTPLNKPRSPSSLEILLVAKGAKDVVQAGKGCCRQGGEVCQQNTLCYGIKGIFVATALAWRQRAISLHADEGEIGGVSYDRSHRPTHQGAANLGSEGQVLLDKKYTV